MLAAPDKFRSSASAREVAHAMAAGARRAGRPAVELPLADGGEGLLDVLGGEVRESVVTGPLGEPVRARWAVLADPADRGEPVAVIEMARASGLELAGGAAANDPEAATTAGTGELVAAAVAAGLRRIIVGCGGSATTDGGSGALEALRGVDLRGVDLVVACDVTTGFLDAAKVFSPQKGADAAAVARLTARLAALAADYQRDFGVDVARLERGGAAGGLAGGLAARGGRLVGGFDVVAGLLGLDDQLARADLVVTGEGRLDPTSFEGKVVGGVLARAAGRVRALVVAGDVVPEARALLPAGVRAISLVERAGRQAALADTCRLVEQVVAEQCAR